MMGLQLSHMVLLALAGVGLGIALVGVWGVIKHKRESAWEEDFMANAHDPVFNDEGIVSLGKRPNPDDQQTYDNNLVETAYENTDRDYQQSTSETGYADDLIIINIQHPEAIVFAGFDCLQAILGAGMRFGDMALFHRYQDPQGQGPILFSLANITDPGTFDLQNINNTETPGLTLFMRRAYQPVIDQERFDLMIQTAHQIAEFLGGGLFTAKKQPLTNKSLDNLRTELA